MSSVTSIVHRICCLLSVIFVVLSSLSTLSSVLSFVCNIHQLTFLSSLLICRLCHLISEFCCLSLPVIFETCHICPLFCLYPSSVLSIDCHLCCLCLFMWEVIHCCPNLANILSFERGNKTADDSLTHSLCSRKCLSSVVPIVRTVWKTKQTPGSVWVGTIRHWLLFLAPIFSPVLLEHSVLSCNNQLISLLLCPPFSALHSSFLLFSLKMCREFRLKYVTKENIYFVCLNFWMHALVKFWIFESSLLKRYSTKSCQSEF